MLNSNSSYYYDTRDQQAGNCTDEWFNHNQKQINHQLLANSSVNHTVAQSPNQFSSSHLSMSGSSLHSVGHENLVSNSSSMPQKSSCAYSRQNQLNPVRSQYSNSQLISLATSNCDFDNEPPLLEELGIDPDQIFQKSLAVLNPLSTTDNVYLEDVDLAGPLVYITMFACFLLLAGKVHFSYIYGISVVGCFSMHALLNMMAISGVSVGMTISVLGYCFFPIVALSGVGILISLQGPLGILLTLMAVLWCSFSASAVFVTALNMNQQLTLIAYPCGILYSVFALLTFF